MTIRWSKAVAVAGLALVAEINGVVGANMPTDTLEAPNAIRSAITDALQPRLGSVGDASFDIGALDARLRLGSCAALDVGLPAAISASVTVKVGCSSPNWTIYVPVRVHAWTEAV